MYTHTHACTHTCACTHAHTHAHVRMHTHTHTCTHKQTPKCTSSCMHTCTHTHTHKNAHTHLKEVNHEDGLRVGKVVLLEVVVQTRARTAEVWDPRSWHRKHGHLVATTVMHTQFRCKPQRTDTHRWEIEMNRTVPAMSWIWWCFVSLCTYWLFWIDHVCIHLFYAAGHKWMYWLSNPAKLYESNPFGACCCIVIV